MVLPLNNKQKASRNRTLALDHREAEFLKEKLIELKKQASIAEIENKTIYQDTFKALNYFPERSIDLAFIDPPYNLNKSFNETSFKKMSSADYETWLESWLAKIKKLLKPNASLYICGDWKSSGPISNVLEKYFIVQNRITWEREKGRGAKENWKNCSEDIWFCTMSNDYYFNVEAVKMKRKVIAPYRDQFGNAKDWEEESSGKYRITSPSNLWTDISIPFWSMPENTDHPTQKPEKLLAKIILASSRIGDIVFDPFLGSGTTSVVAKKLGRKFVGIEIDEYYCCLAEKRLELAEYDKTIQGYSSGVFWERNSLNGQVDGKNSNTGGIHSKQEDLFINTN